MIKNCIKLFLFVFAFNANAQNLEVLKSGEKVVVQSAMKNLKLTKEFGKFETVKLNNTITYKATTSSKPEGVYQLSVKIPLVDKSVVEGQPMLISFQAKSISASLETNESKVNWLFKQTESSAPKDVISKSASLSQNWQTYYIPYKVLFSGKLTEATLALQFGYAPQVFEIKDIEVYVFPITTSVTSLPSTKITYPGMEANAAWRTEAEKRIEEHRKGNFALYFMLNNAPLTNATVSVKQVSHHFKFGAAVSADDINSNVNYFETVKKLFNIIVFENDLKAKRWINEKNRPRTIQAIDKLNANNIAVKGHVLLWPGFNYLPEVYKDNKDNPKKISKLLNDNYTSILTATKGKISHWDVLNEAYSNKDIPTVLGSNKALFDVFNKAKELDPNAKRFINEFGIISGGGLNTIKQDWYYNFVKEIEAKTNGAIDGIGMQSHIGTDVTPPTKVIEILNRFATLKKDIAISEFSLDILDDAAIRAQYTSDFMIAAFSNPAVKEFLFWGFYEPMHPKVALVDQNYQLTKMGHAFNDLVYKKWFTTVNLTSNDKGMVSDKGFYGNYEFSIKHEGKVYEGTFSVLPNEANKLKISLK